MNLIDAEPVAFDAPTLQAAWSPRHGHTVVRFRDRFRLYGGCEEQSEDPAAILGDSWSSADGAEWQQEAASAAWPDRYLQQMVVYGGRIWMFGGMHRYRPERINLNDVWSSADGLSWELVTGAAPWPPRHVFAATVYDGRMWVGCGAPDGEVYYDDLWWSTDGAGWHRCPADGQRFSVRKSPALVSFRESLWVIGGMELLRPGVCAAVNDVWRSADGCAWTRVTGAAAWSSRDFPTVIPYRDRLWLIDGREERSGRHVPELWWSADGADWHRHHASLPWPGRHCASPLLWDSAVWLFGGCESGPREAHYNDVRTMRFQE